jgi:hypothetical protein
MADTQSITQSTQMIEEQCTEGELAEWLETQISVDLTPKKSLPTKKPVKKIIKRQ